jgi:hypothetical protein
LAAAQGGGEVVERERARGERTGSTCTRSWRRTPPMSVVSATSGSALTASSSWAARRRSVRWSCVRLWRVRASDGDIVNGARLDQRRADARRDAVVVGLQFLVEPDEALLEVGADLEADDDERAAGAGGGVEVFDAGDFPEQLLHRPRDAVLDLAGRGAGHGDDDVHHRHLDLRLLLAREHDHRKCAEEQRGEHQQRGDARIYAQRGQPAGESVRGLLAG